MGRHGGGSRGGGRSGGSRSGSSGGSSTRTSTKPFEGCYNRSYVNKRGVRVNYYTTNKNFGLKSYWNIGTIIFLLFITFHMFMMVGGVISSSFSIGGKVDGNPDRIKIIDEIDILTNSEEEELIDLFNDVYDKTGMPITLYTDNFEWKEYYYGNSNLTGIQVYSEELYYSMGYDENAMVFLFTCDNVNGFFDWEYDVYCGDETTKCFSNKCFDEFLDAFHNSMASKGLSDSIKYAWSVVMPNLAKTTFDSSTLFVLPFLLFFYSLFYITLFLTQKKSNEAYKYFKEHPEELDMQPMKKIYSSCPYCGASNSSQLSNCEYCGTLLTISEGNVRFISPKY